MSGFNDCCPETPDITQSTVSYSIAGVSVRITVEDVSPVDADKQQITLQAVDSDGNDMAGYYRIRCWFVDGSAITETRTLSAPPVPGVDEFDKVTDSSGESIFNVENVAGAATTWYLCCSLLGATVISDAITVGT